MKYDLYIYIYIFFKFDYFQNNNKNLHKFSISCMNQKYDNILKLIILYLTFLKFAKIF